MFRATPIRCLAALLALLPATAAMARGYVLVRDGLATQSVRLLEISDRFLVHQDEGEWRSIELAGCIALFDPDARPRTTGSGMLVLADGQRLPGQAISSGQPDEDVLAWNHDWLGRLSVPLDMVSTVRLSPRSVSIAPGDADQILLNNGDRIEGIIISLGDPISLEITTESGPEIVDVPLQRAAAVAMVAKPGATDADGGRRVWFRDGTVLQVDDIRVGDGGFVRLRTRWVDPPQEPDLIRVEEIAAILFDAGGMQPLASLAPSRIDGPSIRYRLPEPRLTVHDAPVGLSPIELHGPLRVHYALPSGTRRFAAQASLPEAARTWGSYELRVYDDDRIVFSAELDGKNPTASINVALRGSELVIAMTEGRYGPIQDRLLLEQAMLLVGE